MGCGIAQVFAVAGYDVIVNDIQPTVLASAISRIKRNIERQVERGDFPQKTARLRLAGSVPVQKYKTWE